MNIARYGLKDLLLAAVKSEVESREVYLQVAGKVNNAFLADRLRFIAEEELKHQDYLESVFRMQFQEDVPDLPETTPVPLPEVHVDRPFVQASSILTQAMEAEQAAADFYESLSDRFDDNEIRSTLIYISRMEITHYRLLEIERDHLQSTEDYEMEWEMMHAGP